MGLTLAWLRRKKLEARMIAVEVGRLFAGESSEPEQITPDRMWAELEAFGVGKTG